MDDMGVKYEIIDTDYKHKGVLVLSGRERSIAVIVEKLPGAKDYDTEVLMQQMCYVYSDYIRRVREYSK